VATIFERRLPASLGEQLLDHAPLPSGVLTHQSLRAVDGGPARREPDLVRRLASSKNHLVTLAELEVAPNFNGED